MHFLAFSGRALGVADTVEVSERVGDGGGDGSFLSGKGRAIPIFWTTFRALSLLEKYPFHLDLVLDLLGL